MVDIQQGQYSLPNITYSKPDNMVKFQLENQAEFDQFYFDLLGYSYDEEKEVYIKDNNKFPLCNEKGANTIISRLRIECSKFIIMSNYNIQDIHIIVENSVTTFLYFLVDHQLEFGFNDDTSIMSVIDAIDNLLFATYLKAIDGNYMNSLNKQISLTEIKETKPEEKKQGFIGKLLG